MRVHKVIHHPIRVDRDGISIAGQVDAVIAANVGTGGTSVVHTTSNVTTVQGRGTRRPRKQSKEDKA